MYLHATENHKGNALCSLRGTTPTKAIIIPRKIKEVQELAHQNVNGAFREEELNR